MEEQKDKDEKRGTPTEEEDDDFAAELAEKAEAAELTKKG